MKECTALTCKPRQNICTVNSKKLSLSSETQTFAETVHSFPRLYSNLTEHALLTLKHILSQMNTVLTFTSLSFYSYFDTIFPPIGLHYFPHGVSRQSVETYIYLSFRWYVTRSTYPPEWMKLIVFGDELNHTSHY
jgi:hypothetical protein